MQLRNIAGGDVLMLVKSIDPIKLQRVRLMDVDDGGVWIKSSDVQNRVFKTLNVKPAPQPIEFFLPFQEIGLIVTAEALDAAEKATT